MKENNKTKYLLGISLFGIWGLLGFRFYEKMNRNESYTLVAPNTQITAVKEKQIFEFSLIGSFPDPFQKKVKPKERSNRTQFALNRAPAKIQLSTNKQVKKVKFPKVEYKGNIVNEQGKVTAIVKINKEFLNLNLFEFHQDIEITKIYPDSIIIRKDGMEKTITR